MRAFDWFRLLEQQAREHDKRVFTATELANLSGATSAVLGVTLHRLRAQGVVLRLAQGLYGIAPVSPEILLPFLDPCAYITEAPALFLQGFITQQPRVLTCFTNRRHSSRRRESTVGVFELRTIIEPIYSYPGTALAPPEQAFFDYVYRCRLESVGARGLTLRRLDELRRDVLGQIAGRYPRVVRDYAQAILENREARWDLPRSRRQNRATGQPRERSI